MRERGCNGLISYRDEVTYRNQLEPTWIAMTRELVPGGGIIACDEEVKQDIDGKLTAAGVDSAVTVSASEDKPTRATARKTATIRRLSCHRV